MAESSSARSGNLMSPGFPPAAKLILLCSPLFLSLPHAWRMVILSNLGELRPELRLSDMYHLLEVEIIFSIMAVPISMLADATSGLTSTFMSFLYVSCLAPVLGSVAELPGFDIMTRVYLLKAGAAFTGIAVITSVLERAFFVRLMSPNSSTFNVYIFLGLYLGIVWQFVNSMALYFPRFFDFVSDGLMAWIVSVYFSVTWLYMIVMYNVVIHFQPKETEPGGNSFKVVVCLYLAVFYAMKMIWAKMRWNEVPYRDVFQACERWYPKPIVFETRQTFKLFVLVMCLMYLFGMELILRTIWVHQDDELSRHQEAPFMRVFPLDMLLLIYLIVLYPVVYYLVLPYVRKKLHFRLTDLRLVGVSLILYNLSYIATMALEWRVLSASVSSPHSGNVAMRMYNCMLIPVAWTVKNPEITPVRIVLPGRMSRTFINEVAGKYEIAINSSAFNYDTSMVMEKGDAKVFAIRGGELEAVTAIERQLDARPDHYGDDTHLFIVNGLLNTTHEYLLEKRVEVYWKSKDEPIKGVKIDMDFTHILLKNALHDIALKLGNTTFDLNVKMADHGVYSIMIYDSWDGTDEGYTLTTVSQGFVYSRAWANVQVFLLALGMTVGQIPMIHYTYKHAPLDLLATCFSFHRCATASSTFVVWFITSRYGLGPGPSTISTMIVIMFTVFFVFLSVSDIIPSDDDKPKQRQSAGAEDLTSNSGSLKFMKSIFDVSPPPQTVEPSSKLVGRESLASEKEKKDEKSTKSA